MSIPSLPGAAELSSREPPLAPGRRILGIDPGLQVTGYAVLENRAGKPHICEAGVIRTAKSKSGSADLALRLESLYSGIVEILEEFRPQAMVLEQVFAHYKHPRTAVLMAHARGCILLAAAQRGVPVISYMATRIKKTITGHGRASKEQMQLTMLRELNLPRMPEPHDVADALAAALCYHCTHRTPG